MKRPGIATTGDCTMRADPSRRERFLANIFVPRESQPGEQRVAATPETVKRLVKEGFAVEVATGAGEAASFADGDYQAAGATVAADGAGSATWPAADVVLKVAPPT